MLSLQALLQPGTAIPRCVYAWPRAVQPCSFWKVLGPHHDSEAEESGHPELAEASPFQERLVKVSRQRGHETEPGQTDSLCHLRQNSKGQPTAEPSIPHFQHPLRRAQQGATRWDVMRGWVTGTGREGYPRQGTACAKAWL